jgi:hypothetical protein
MLEVDLIDELEFQASFKPSGPVTLQDVLARHLAPDRADLEEAARTREKAAAREEAAETRRMLNYRAGDPLGQLTRAEASAGAIRDEVRDLEGRLEETRGRLHRAAEQVVDYRAAADEIMAASVRRSSAPDLLAPAKKALAEERVERMLAERSARPRRQAPRPFASVSRTTVRSEQCVWCVEQNVSDHDSYLLHSDPEFNVPVTTPGQAAQAERRGHAGYAEIAR